MIKRVLLDMDGVLTNFHKGVCKAFHYPCVLDEMIRYAFWEDWKEKNVTGQDVNNICNQVFWEDLEWMHDGKEILRIVEDAYGKENIFIITLPMPNAGSWTGKRIWIEHMAPDYKKQLIVTQASRAFFASPNTLLIDDKQENVDEFIKAGGNAILIPRPWNRLRGHRVIPHLEKEILAIRHSEHLKHATQDVANQLDERIREFDTGAYRDTDDSKLDYEACLSPIVLKRYAEYIAKKREVPIWKEKGVRPDDNWQMGIPRESYIKSKLRHLINTWMIHRGFPALDEKGNKVDLEEALCAEMFNTMGYLFELLKDKECLENAPQA